MEPIFEFIILLCVCGVIVAACTFAVGVIISFMEWGFEFIKFSFTEPFALRVQAFIAVALFVKIKFFP